MGPMTRRASRVTDTDVALLRSIGRERSVVAASRALGISRDRAVYRLGRLARAFGGPVVEGARGGRGHGATALTALGDRVLRGGFDTVELIDARPLVEPPRPNLLAGVYRAGPPPEVVVGPRLRLRVAFAADDGATVRLLLDPDAIVVARRRFASSARNLVPGTVVSIQRAQEGFDRTLRVRVGRSTLRVTVTEEPIHQLRLRPGSRVVLYVKATALRRVADA
jgi:molybdate transport repressor ModE-like protein/molybdopterin-binding protein